MSTTFLRLALASALLAACAGTDSYDESWGAEEIPAGKADGLLDSAEQLEGIGYFDALEGGGVAVVEWGDRFDEARTSDSVEVRLEIEGDELRAIRISAAGERGRAVVAKWAEAARRIDGITFEAEE